MNRRVSGVSNFRPRFDQERRHGRGDEQRDRDAREDQLIALCPIVDGAGDEGAEEKINGTGQFSKGAKWAELQSFGSVEFGEISVEGPQRKVTGFPSCFEDQTIREP